MSRLSTATRAHRLVSAAIANGTLVRPSTCSDCGKTPKPGSDGRATIHGHHHKGYDHPLDVEWLCPKCHRLRDPQPSGAEAPYAVLTQEQVDSIRSSEIPSTVLAPKYGVHPGTIQAVRRGRTWKATATRESIERAKLFNRGSRCSLAKLTEEIVRAIRLDTRSQPAIARDYGITQSHVSRIKLRKNWAHV